MTGKRRRLYRREVFYIPGFDPHPARRYRELYRTEGAAQAAIAGYRLEQGPAPGGWRVAMEADGVASEARVTVLAWSDLVRASMRLGLLGTYLALFRTAWIYLSTGALARVARLRKGPLIAALLPVAVLLGGVMAVVGAVLAVHALAGWLAGLLAGAVVALLAWRLDRRVFASYLMQDYAYAASERGAYPVSLEERLEAFVERVRASGDVDEILIVGHSSGAYLAISVMADLLRKGAPDGPQLSLLTLGQVVPMVSFLPEAHRLRADLAALSGEERITWVDVTAPGDGCSFALTDPVTASGVAVENQRWPLVLSAAFSETLAPERLAALKYRYFRLHFQYLCAFDDPSRYDYFAITAGAIPLSERFGTRAPSPSLIKGRAA